MPIQDEEQIFQLTGEPIQAALEPAHNLFKSMALLANIDCFTGLDEWVTIAESALTPEQRFNNRLVMIGLGYAVTPDRSWPSFTAYIHHLEAMEPEIFRIRLFNSYAQIKRDETICTKPDASQISPTFDYTPLLESLDRFLHFLMERFSPEKIEPAIETEAFRYIKDPVSMKDLIVSHFKTMWKEVLSSEWERVLPKLQSAVDAIRQLDFKNVTKFDAAQQVFGQELDELWKVEFEHVKKLIFVPSAHLGPYLKSFVSGSTMWMLFGARIPKGAQIQAPDLNRAELLVRINAFSDDTRLRILKLINESGEQRSTDIMTDLGLSQSAASRHLKQLSAVGYLNERRCEGAKCYRLNPKRIEDTLKAISNFILNP